MSITDIFNKIKSKIEIDISTILLFLIIIGVGISSFGLGRLSVVNSFENKNKNIVVDSNNDIYLTEKDIENNLSFETAKERMFVASKSGKLYYSLNCSGANKIKEENKMYFKSKEDAEKFGYVYSSSCK